MGSREFSGRESGVCVELIEKTPPPTPAPDPNNLRRPNFFAPLPVPKTVGETEAADINAFDVEDNEENLSLSGSSLSEDSDPENDDLAGKRRKPSPKKAPRRAKSPHKKTQRKKKASPAGKKKKSVTK